MGTPFARFSQFLRDPATPLGYLLALFNGCEARYIGHNPAGGAMILALMAAMAATAFTGWMMTTDTYFGVKWVGELHETVAHGMLLLVLIHIGGVYPRERAASGKSGRRHDYRTKTCRGGRRNPVLKGTRWRRKRRPKGDTGHECPFQCTRIHSCDPDLLEPGVAREACARKLLRRAFDRQQQIQLPPAIAGAEIELGGFRLRLAGGKARDDKGDDTKGVGARSMFSSTLAPAFSNPVIILRASTSVRPPLITRGARIDKFFRFK